MARAAGCHRNFCCSANYSCAAHKRAGADGGPLRFLSHPNSRRSLLRPQHPRQCRRWLFRQRARCRLTRSGLPCSLPLRNRLSAPIACNAPAEFARFDRPLLAHDAAPGERRAAHHRCHRIVIDRRRRREFARGELSEPACCRSSPALSRPRHHGDQSRRQRRRDRRHDGAICDRGVRRASATRALAGRHQFGAARSPARHPCGAAPPGHRRDQGGQCRLGFDRSAIRARSNRQVRNAGHGRTDRARGQGTRMSICFSASR